IRKVIAAPEFGRHLVLVSRTHIRDIPCAHMAETARHDGRARLSDETTHRYLGGAIHGLSSTSCFFCGGSRCRLYSCGTRLVSDLCAINTSLKVLRAIRWKG